ncbi:hypothetical protein K502DRAFT_333150 [Neoconidiobolus thromboides FSU 785]|nr:hypothetical protein K502DRAFT_333150 [Neoconidiobolus thromboides FSU 785]
MAEDKSIELNYDNLRPDEITLPYNINRCFDEVMRCNSFGQQMVHYYRYGSKKDCSLVWKRFKFGLTLTTLNQTEKIEKIKKFEKELWEEREGEVSSLDVWEKRKVPLENFPPKLE